MIRASSTQPRGHNIWICLSLLVAALHSVSCFVYASTPLLLTQDGQPLATIVLGEKPTVSAQLAAHELQYHLQKISGAILPIVREPQAVSGTVILVGESK